jgi:methyltransferase
MFGAPQIIAILILLQRGLEEVYSSTNTKRLLAEGAQEAGAQFYPVVATAHLGWIASLFLLISPNANITWPLLILYVLLQVVRYWVIGSLGRYWTHRIITLDREPLVRRGPYKYIRHPNYVITLIETMLLPLAFGAWGLALIMTAIWAAVLHYKILLEDAALAKRREATKA